ncbi:hypothetical protein BGZ80_011457 [Entomortierella chlamydospora]|uniref:P-loop containing nucleoside triphosphate hydrolase protein n=1 Tax=Entomortierella chlamydospora TaxID=101097 RepID=A0A9P6SZ15_9FUNG|nr:hypothetical protein BGZ80_011457 [Entomortierella chlamydospora]
MDFTLCFQDSVLTLIPNVILLIFFSPRLHKVLGKGHLEGVKASASFYVKMLLVLASWAIQLAILIEIVAENNYRSSSLLSTIVYLVGLTGAAALHWFEYFNMANTSAGLLVFWIFTALISIFPTRSWIQTSSDGLSSPLPLLKLLFTIVSFLVFIAENITKPHRASLTRPNVEVIEQQNPSPEPRANYFTRVTFFWLLPLLRLGKKKTLRMDDLWSLHPKLLSYPLYLTTKAKIDADEAITLQSIKAESEKGINREDSKVKKGKINLFGTVLHTVGYSFLSAVFPRLLYIAAFYVRPILITNLIGFVNTYSEAARIQGIKPEKPWVGFGLTIAVFVSAIFSTLFDGQFQFICSTASLKARGVLVNLIYRKALRLSSTNKQEVAYDRLRDFLNSEEVDDENVLRNSDATSSEIAYEVVDGTFGWYTPEAIQASIEKKEKEDSDKAKADAKAAKKNKTAKKTEEGERGGKEKKKKANEVSDEKKDQSESTRDSMGPVLHNINLSIKRGSLTLVVGRVGEGKSSLVGALLGEMHKYSGTVRSFGSLAYVSQSAWILNDTVRNNILFGQPYNKERYLDTIRACALVPDFKMLVNSDKTVIGEKGINLSGGQKQRISIARAVYANADVYIFDDPLSAVDAHVDEHIFNHALTSILAKKTRILITNGVNHLKDADQIIVLKQGRISQDGQYDDLIRNEQGDLFRLIQESKLVASKADEDEEEETSSTTESDEGGEEGSITENSRDEAVTDNKSNDIQKRPTIKRAKSSKIKEDHIEIDEKDEVDDEVVTQGNIGWSVYSYYLSTLGVFNICASKKLHYAMLLPMIRSPMSFFDVTSSGKIVNRFSHDINSVDIELPLGFVNLMFITFAALNTFGMCVAASPYFVIIMIPLAFGYYQLGGFFLVSNRELKRLDSAARSPLYAHFGETLSGLVTIRAFSDSDRFAVQATAMLDRSQQTSYLINVTARWLQIMLDLLSVIVLTSVAVLAILQRNSVNQQIFSIVLSNIGSLTIIMSRILSIACQLETTIVSVERVREYIQLTPEARDIIPDSKTDEAWPQHGQITFNQYSTRYREGLDLVLKDVSVTVKGGERIGIVGRTGAGKSSVTMALFRIIEAAKGSIIIDGVDISTLGLHELRSRLTIIPQDPFLFGESIRANLDPLNKYNDAEIWAALESASLKNYVQTLPEALSTTIENGGENMSLGQRQLMSLARAMITKNTRVLCLDEATAAIDVETDNAIQRALRREFSGCTVLTIAHRINTIMDSDRILVLEKGQVAEYDSPQNLLQNKDSIFYSLAAKSGNV